jgi:hypothetical protein
MANYDSDPRPALYERVWAGYQHTEFGHFTSDSADAELGLTDIFAIASEATEIDFEPVQLLPGNEKSTIVTDPGELEETIVDGQIISKRSSVMVHEPVDVSGSLPDWLLAEMDTLDGVTRGVRLIRLISTTETKPVGAPEDVLPQTELLTRDMVQVVNLATQPPTVLGELARPQVVSVANEDHTGFAKRYFADPTQPSYEQLLDGIEKQIEFRAVLGAVCTAQNVEF